MRKLFGITLLLVTLLLLFSAPMAFAAKANNDDVQMYVFTLMADPESSLNGNGNHYGRLPKIGSGIPPTDNSMTNPDYQLLSFHWFTTINYYVNPTNTYGFSSSSVDSVIITCAGTWDVQTSAEVFSYAGETTRTAGVRDYHNVVSWGSYSQKSAIAVTMIWARGRQVLETDCLLNVYYAWSLTGESGKMDVQSIMTHEFGHWCGLADLYQNRDYWLTMYGYADYGQTWKQTLGRGDILGLQRVYGQ